MQLRNKQYLFKKEIHIGLKQLFKKGIRCLFFTSNKYSYSFWNHISYHFTVCFSVLVICHHPLPPPAPTSAILGKKANIFLYSPNNHSSIKTLILVSLPSDCWGCSVTRILKRMTTSNLFWCTERLNSIPN